MTPPVDLRRRGVLQWVVALAWSVVARDACAGERIEQLHIAQRRIQKGARTIRVNVDDQVELRWTTDEATTVHVHGYDIALALIPGTEGRMRFAAGATGRYPISAHGFESASAGASHREVVLIYLEVLPR